MVGVQIHAIKYSKYFKYDYLIVRYSVVIRASAS